MKSMKRFWRKNLNTTRNCDLREEQSRNARDSMLVNLESVSNEIDESDLQDEKRPEQRTRT
jgi:hypothetical protein